MIVITREERNARAYCISIGADPDEVVLGRSKDTGGLWCRLPRWWWYRKARP